MASIYIQVEDLVLSCPHCGIEVLEIEVNRVWDPILQCEACEGFYELSVFLSES